MKKLKLLVKTYVFLYKVTKRKELTIKDLKELKSEFEFNVEALNPKIGDIAEENGFIGGRDNDTGR